jgi:RNA polymerase sigma-70 factor, ECF subfamily
LELGDIGGRRNTMPDAEMVFGIVEGRIGFAKFLERFRGGVYKLIYALVRNRADAEELTQDIFAGVPELLPTYDPKKGTVNTWLYSIVYNRVMNFLKKRNRSPLRLDLMLDSEGPSVAGPDELHEANERSARLQQAYDRLKPFDRAVFTGFYLLNLPWRVVAAGNHCSVRHARYRALVAQRKLREAL